MLSAFDLLEVNPEPLSLYLIWLWVSMPVAFNLHKHMLINLFITSSVAFRTLWAISDFPVPSVLPRVFQPQCKCSRVPERSQTGLHSYASLFIKGLSSSHTIGVLPSSLEYRLLYTVYLKPSPSTHSELTVPALWFCLPMALVWGVPESTWHCQFGESQSRPTSPFFSSPMPWAHWSIKSVASN